MTEQERKKAERAKIDVAVGPDFREQMTSIDMNYADPGEFPDTTDAYLSLDNDWLSDKYLEQQPTASLHVLSGGLELSLVAVPFKSLKQLARFILDYVKEHERR